MIVPGRPRDFAKSVLCALLSLGHHAALVSLGSKWNFAAVGFKVCFGETPRLCKGRNLRLADIYGNCSEASRTAQS